MEEKVLTRMLEIYQPEEFDWMGYPISKDNPLSYCAITNNNSERIADKMNLRKCRIVKKVTEFSNGKKEWTVIQKCHIRQTIINCIVSKFLSHNLDIKSIALVTEEGLKKLDEIAEISPELFTEYMYMFQIINDMSCPPVQEIRKLMGVIKKRLEADLQNQAIIRSYR